MAPVSFRSRLALIRIDSEDEPSLLDDHEKKEAVHEEQDFVIVASRVEAASLDRIPQTNIGIVDEKAIRESSDCILDC